MKMTHTFPHLTFFFLLIGIIFSKGIPAENPLICSICFQPLQNEYSVDAWNNPFHSDHIKEGVFCSSCSRIISQGITQGGYRYSDGRHLCSLCQVSVVKNDSMINNAYKSVILQLEKVGIKNIPTNIPVKLINLIELNKKLGNQLHGNLKGFTQSNQDHNLNISYKIFILYGLPQIEFEATLAHELLHVWLNNNKYHLKREITEGFCNLGSALIYSNDGTQFSKIHLMAMEIDPHHIYGNGYRKLHSLKEKSDWNSLILDLLQIE